MLKVYSKILGSRFAAALFTMIVSAESSLAEVCDKTWGVPENWHQDSGPVYRGLVLSPLVTLSLIIVLAILIWRFKLSKVSFLSAALSLIWLYLVLNGDPDTRDYAVREGCISDQTDFLILVTYGFAAAVFVSLGFVVRNKL